MESLLIELVELVKSLLLEDLTPFAASFPCKSEPFSSHISVHSRNLSP